MVEESLSSEEEKRTITRFFFGLGVLTLSESEASPRSGTGDVAFDVSFDKVGSGDVVTAGDVDAFFF